MCCVIFFFSHGKGGTRYHTPCLESDVCSSYLSPGKGEVGSLSDVRCSRVTIRAGLDALLAHGRPNAVALAVLIDRRFSRELPIEPNYIGKHVDSIGAQHVKVFWSEEGGEDRVILLNEKPS